MVATRHRKISQATAGKRKRAETKKKTKKEKKKKSNGEEGRGKKVAMIKRKARRKHCLHCKLQKRTLQSFVGPTSDTCSLSFAPSMGKGERNRAGNSGGKWPDLTNMAAGGRSNGEHAERTLCRSWRQGSSGAPTPGERTAEPCRDVPQLPRRRFCELRKLSGYVLMKTHVRERA